jgi:hypothetical protein
VREKERSDGIGECVIAGVDRAESFQFVFIKKARICHMELLYIPKEGQNY